MVVVVLVVVLVLAVAVGEADVMLWAWIAHAVSLIRRVAIQTQLAFVDSLRIRIRLDFFFADLHGPGCGGVTKGEKELDWVTDEVKAMIFVYSDL